MRALVRPEHVVSLLERLYSDRASSIQAWAESVVPAMRPLIQRAGFAGISAVRLDPPTNLVIAYEPNFLSDTAARMGAQVERVDPVWLTRHYRPPRPVMLRSELGPLPKELEWMLPALHGSDALGLAVEPEPGLGVAFAVIVSESLPPSAAERALLTRVALHLDAAVRLRQRPDAVVGYVTPEGRVELGAGGGEVRASALGAAAQGIDRARTRKYRGDGEEALSVWPALVSGRLSLAERVDRDGKRLYDLYENAPRHERVRALTEREGTVLHECARGLSNKEVAYALGVSQAAVSQALASAAHKLGLSSVRAMVRLVSGLRGAGSAVVSVARLSESERAVASLVARGMSNAQIARERGSAERTVANQVASILRKTGARSRRELTVARVVGAGGE